MVLPLNCDSDLKQLPPLSDEEQHRSEQLTRLLVREIEQAGGMIDFSHYMQLALYAPGLGYYASGLQKFGEAGDFITAPELGNLFARCLARQIAEVFGRIGGGSILEVGAGSGTLAADLITELEVLGCLPDYYLVLETSPELEARQRQSLKHRGAQGGRQPQWLRRWPENICGVVIANELLDALPVQRFRITASGVRLIGVGWDGVGFVEREYEPSDPRIVEQFESLGLPVGYASEWHPQAQAWVRSVADVIELGVALLIDYGYTAREFYHPQRSQGTLLCHYRHRAHGNPYINVGVQDITSHIDFSVIANTGQNAGLEVLGFTSQAAFLMSLGLTELAEKQAAHSTRDRVMLAQQMRKLILPSDMGELFKVLALGKGVNPPLCGFQLSDHRDRL